MSRLETKKLLSSKKKEDIIIEGRLVIGKISHLLKIKEIKIANQPTSSEKNLSSSQDKVKPTKGESNGS